MQRFTEGFVVFLLLAMIAVMAFGAVATQVDLEALFSSAPDEATAISPTPEDVISSFEGELILDGPWSYPWTRTGSTLLAEGALDGESASQESQFDISREIAAFRASENPSPSPTTTTTIPVAVPVNVTTTTTQPPVAAPETPVTTTTQPPVTTSQPPTATTESPSTVPPNAVAVNPGESIQAAVDAHPAGTTFFITPGRHVRQSVVPKDGQTFIGEAGTVMDGERATSYAFIGEGASSVTISGIEITGYNARFFPRDGDPRQGFSHGAITSNTTDTRGSGAGQNWTVEHCNIHHNLSGLLLGDGATVRNNHIHHNDQIGFKVLWTNSALVQGNEINHNNPDHAYSYGWEAGGTKFAWTNNLVVRGNFSHHNIGPGLWTDIDNVGTLYENNTVSNNRGAGIFHEISYSAVIRNNTITDNGPSDPAWMWDAGILVAASSDVEIYGNVVSGNANGISAVQQNRGSGAHGTYLVQNLWVHDNTIIMPRGRTGAVQDNGDNAIFSSRNNRFDGNTYQLGSAGDHFAWDGRWMNQAEWVATGNDVNSTFQ